MNAPPNKENPMPSASNLTAEERDSLACPCCSGPAEPREECPEPDCGAPALVNGECVGCGHPGPRPDATPLGYCIHCDLPFPAPGLLP